MFPRATGPGNRGSLATGPKGFGDEDPPQSFGGGWADAARVAPVSLDNYLVPAFY